MPCSSLLKFAKAGGANVVGTTSSPAKAEVLRRLGVDHVINYHETPEWGEAAKRLTGRNEGFDNIIEIGGAGTMTQSMHAVRKEGVITVIGVVTGLEATMNSLETVFRIFTLRGIHVGSKQQFIDMMAAMETNKIQPLIDERRFTFEQLPDALQPILESGHQW